VYKKFDLVYGRDEIDSLCYAIKFTILKTSKYASDQRVCMIVDGMDPDTALGMMLVKPGFV
jgi:hypothetical protein